MISKNQLKYHRQLETKKYRQQEGLFVAEGPKVVGDLLKAGFIAHQLYATQAWMTEHADERAQLVTEDELRKLSFLQHPQSVVAQFQLPRHTAAEQAVETARHRLASHLSLALDGVQDPGNMGTIIRIADWFGIDTIFCSRDTVDVWNPKVVQATMGSIARVDIVYCDLCHLLTDVDVPVYGTLLDGNNIYSQELRDEGVIVMGNEGNGISAPVRRLITERLLIPPYRQGAESLNVAIATAITCAEFRRREFSA